MPGVFVRVVHYVLLGRYVSDRSLILENVKDLCACVSVRLLLCACVSDIYISVACLHIFFALYVENIVQILRAEQYQNGLLSFWFCSSMVF